MSEQTALDTYRWYRCTYDRTHSVGHPYVSRTDGTLWCLACYARVVGHPVIEPVSAPTGTRDRLVLS